jgi:predicted AAA+ superfamily ATPase
VKEVNPTNRNGTGNDSDNHIIPHIGLELDVEEVRNSDG